MTLTKREGSYDQNFKGNSQGIYQYRLYSTTELLRYRVKLAIMKFTNPKLNVGFFGAEVKQLEVQLSKSKIYKYTLFCFCVLKI